MSNIDNWKLEIFEREILWKILGAAEDATALEWRKLHNVELCDLTIHLTLSELLNLLDWDGLVM